MEENMNTSAAPQTGSSAGPIIGAIIILAVVIFGALYFMGEQGDRALNSQVESIETQSDSDELADIEADLEATETNNLDAELNSY